jgi:hypothetical protein
MWAGVVVLVFAFQTFGVFASKLHRESMNAIALACFVLACVITLLHNKIRFGVFLPGVKKGNDRWRRIDNGRQLSAVSTISATIKGTQDTELPWRWGQPDHQVWFCDKFKQPSKWWIKSASRPTSSPCADSYGLGFHREWGGDREPVKRELDTVIRAVAEGELVMLLTPPDLIDARLGKAGSKVDASILGSLDCS